MVKQFLQELGVVIKSENNETEISKKPNAKTIKAIEDARNGKVSKIEDVKGFFNGI